MTCPGCRAQVAPDAAICPRCDFIIDASFLPGSDASGDAPAAGTVAAPAARAQPALPSVATGTVTDPAELFAQARAFFLERTRADRIALGGLGVLLLAAFMPWKETALDGDVLGLMSLGALAFGGALLALAALYVRVRGALPRLPAHGAWLAQLAAALFCVFWCAVYLRLASDSTTLPSAVGSYALVRATPSFGLFLALLGALGALAGTLLALRDPGPRGEGPGAPKKFDAVKA